MRILYIDIDTTRADHMGCYGYNRNTTPNIDSIAKDGVTFTNYYNSDAPCLPSRTALFSGQHGINTGVVNHGGVASELRHDPKRDFKHRYETDSLFGLLRVAGYHTVGITPFPSRHSAWYYYAGFSEMYDTGLYGDESTEHVLPIAKKWLKDNKDRDNWYLHVNFWDPHTPYRTPDDYNPFKDEPLDNWITDEIFEKHLEEAGPHHAQEINMYWSHDHDKFKKAIGRLNNKEDLKKLFDGYDAGIKYADDAVGEILAILKEQGIYEDMAIIMSTDHGENMGELGIYAEHGTADHINCRIPMIVKWPGGMKNHKDDGLHYNLDLLPTIAELINKKPKNPEFLDGRSYASSILKGEDTGRDFLVTSQMAHVCQRGVRFGDYMYIRTYHDGYHNFPKHMLFNLKEDPHEQFNLADKMPELVKEASSILYEWHDDQMLKQTALMGEAVDPLWIVMREGGPFHAAGLLAQYVERQLVGTDREHHIEEYKKKHPREFNPKNRKF